MTLCANDSDSFTLTDSLSSTQLVSAVLQANPKLEAAQATWQAALARVEQQSAFDDPQLHYSFAPLSINNAGTAYGQKVTVSQHIPFPGKLSTRAKTAQYQAQIEQQNIASLQLLLATTAKSLFANWYFIHRAQAIHNTSLSLLAEFRRIAMTRYSTGRANKQDVLRVEMEQARLRHQLIVLARQRKTLLAQLNTLLNRPVDRPLPIPQPLPEIRFLPDLKQLHAKAMQLRPELRASAANINAYKTQAKLAELAYYPDFKLSLSYNSLWDNEDKRFNIGVGINIPLDQSKRRAAEQEAKANSAQAHWHKIDLEAQISEQLARVHAQLEESQHVLQLYRQQLLPLADDSVAAATADYQSGNGDFLSLMSSEKNRLQVQLQAEQALVNVHHRFAELEQAIGRLEPLASTQTGTRIP